MIKDDDEEAGKPPADLFYWGDWLRDDKLQQTSPSTRGIWANILAFAWFADEQGRISGTKESLARLGKCSPGEFDAFLAEVELFGFCDVSHIVTKMSQQCHTIVTLTNRRTYRKWLKREKARKDAAERKREQRQKKEPSKAVTQMSQECPPRARRPRASYSIAFANNPLTPKGEAVDYSEEFEDWIKHYPNKQGRTRALEYFSRRRAGGQSAEELTTGKDAYIKSKEGTITPKFANSSTFLNPKPRGDSANVDDFIQIAKDEAAAEKAAAEKAEKRRAKYEHADGPDRKPTPDPEQAEKFRRLADDLSAGKTREE